MEKLIEHRPPPDMFGFWKRPAIPQRESVPVTSPFTLLIYNSRTFKV